MRKADFKKLKDEVVYILMSPVRLIKFICFSIGAFVLFFTTLLGIYVGRVVYTTPDISTLKFNDLREIATKSVDKKREDKKKRLEWTPIADINRDFLYAIVFSEDQTFFDHNGVNYDALINSLAENIKKREYAYGGSTISQQVVKNLFFTNDKSIRRKIQEILVVRKLEKQFKKNEILELYLNLAELGPDMYGVREAANHYFGKEPKQINAAEGTFVALMLPSPRGNYYKVYENKNLTKQSRKHINRVLRDMLFKEFITESEYRQFSKYNFFKPHKERKPTSKSKKSRRH
jgi:monofunctional glycosyltransferase